ncbi:hypothetical protein PT974_11031 [Cladobotryum mycophilum]|uniref:Uncharacterized protein n=1 Tax=Cladobotryum mycophilum TaxID=491253 RepID=A0ABR0SBH1_9HYPO
MCNWDTYLFQCAHIDILLKSHCDAERIGGYLLCEGVQVVHTRWTYVQSGICSRCQIQEDAGIPITRRLPSWDEISSPLAT